MTSHAENRAPSDAHRWLSCPGSVDVCKTYPREDSEASKRGDEAHMLLNAAFQFGILPDHPNVDLWDRVGFAFDNVMKTFKGYGGAKKCRLHTEVQLDIPETGEWGTADVVLETEDLIHIIDYKDGWVFVDVRMNPQLLCYLCGAIAKYGERKNYKISIIQPTKPHIDGMFRSYDVTEEDLVWFRKEVAWSMIYTDQLAAGKHCKYCPHKGACDTFLPWAKENFHKAYNQGEFRSVSDEQLAEYAEFMDIIKGTADAIRGEIMRRILHQDRTIPGWKVVQAKKDRAFKDGRATDAVFAHMRDVMGVPDEALYTQHPLSVAEVEKVFKGHYKSQGRGAWLRPFHETVDPHLASQDQALTVEKAIDGRRQYRKGTEFTVLVDETEIKETKLINGQTEQVATKQDDGLVDII